MTENKQHHSELLEIYNEIKRAFSVELCLKEEQIKHIKNLSNQVNKDKNRISNWNDLNSSLIYSVGTSLDDFANNLNAAMYIHENSEQFVKDIADLCGHIGPSDLDDAKFVYKLHKFNEKYKNYMGGAKILSDYNKNVIEVEKKYYSVIYKNAAAFKTQKLDVDWDWQDNVKRRDTAIVIAAVLSLILTVGAFFMEDYDLFEAFIPLVFLFAIATAILTFVVFFIMAIAGPFVINILLLIVDGLLFLASPITKLYLNSKAKKSLESTKNENVSLQKYDFIGIFAKLKDALDKTMKNSEVGDNDMLHKVAPYLWQASSLEDAVRKYMKANGLSDSSSSSSYSSRSYSSSSSYGSSGRSYSSSSSTSREKSFEEINGIPQSNSLDQKMKDLARSKGCTVIYKNYYGRWTAADSYSTYSVYEGYDSSLQKCYFEFSGKKHYHGNTYPDSNKIYYV